MAARGGWSPARLRRPAAIASAVSAPASRLARSRAIPYVGGLFLELKIVFVKHL
jgi:hypothetical protein